jgi:hypothetical protein
VELRRVEAGGVLGWVALDADTRRVVAVVVGDRSEFTAECLWLSLAGRRREPAHLARWRYSWTSPPDREEVAESVDFSWRGWTESFPHTLGRSIVQQQSVTELGHSQLSRVRAFLTAADVSRVRYPDCVAARGAAVASSRRRVVADDPDRYRDTR